MKRSTLLMARFLLAFALLLASMTSARADSSGPSAQSNVYLPIVNKNSSGPTQDWPQLGHDAQRTNYTTEEVDPPYCYLWKWDAVPVASRAQPVVAGGRFFVGGLDGVLYARDATTGAPLWSFPTGGPIRNSPGVAGNLVITGSYDGYTYALNVINGSLVWKTNTGSSMTAPLIDSAHNRVYVASTYGVLTALNISNGQPQWSYTTSAAILISPSLSQDGSLVIFGDESVRAIAVSASTGKLQWQTTLQGQSLSDRYPVVAGNSVIFRSQPQYYFPILLSEGDTVMDSAGSLLSDWNADWTKVKPQILKYLQGINPTGHSLQTLMNPQTFFVLNTSNGTSQGIAPVLYTFGSDDTPAPPVIAKGQAYVAYRARHGIQTDGGAIHVMSKYDAELGAMNLSTLDITGLRNSNPLSGQPQFRMTSDEGGVLTMGGNNLWVDNWERVGGINVSNGQLIAIGNVSNDWPECYTQCGPGGPNPYFPLSGNPNDPAYPFPSPRVTEGHARSGVVLANHMIYWHAIEAGMAGIGHVDGGSCPTPAVWRDSAGKLPAYDASTATAVPQSTTALSDYVTNDLNNPVPVTQQNQDLVNRLNSEIQALLQAANGKHLMPYFTERGMTVSTTWPYNVPSGNAPPVLIAYEAQGNAYWFDPGELLYTMAMAYPYLSPSLQSEVKNYMSGEMSRYPPLQDLPYNNTSRDWLRSGSQREPYTVPFRAQLNNWPPAAANISSIYALWLWSKNTGDWSYAQNNWSAVQNLFNARKGSLRYYSDVAGVIGYYRLSIHFGKSSEATTAMQTAVSALTSGLNFNAYVTTANNDYKDPRGMTTGWSAPVFFGLTPEIGAYLADQTGGQAQNLINSLESLNSSGNGLLWWYLTRAGEHGEAGETDFLAPVTAWSHFLAHAYILHNNQATLRKYLDRPWAPGDLYSLQKIVAAIQAQP